MRKPMVAGNWKMHGAEGMVKALVQDLLQKAPAGIEIVLFPTFVHLAQVKELLKNSLIGMGAQNLYAGEQGAFTGEVAGPMLAECGCRYVLIGHSERRHLFKESLELVTAKFAAALKAGLKPILCVGETLTEREKGVTNHIIEEQITSVLDQVGVNGLQQAIIAYEPVWAIGTGLTASPEQAQEVHAMIRDLLAQNNVDLAETIRILYGGSLKPENAASLFAMPDIDGGLVGGASLDAKSFLAICEAAKQKQGAVSIH